MARFLFVVPPMAGHTHPTIAVAQELDALGHETAWVGHEAVVGRLLPDPSRLFPLDGDLPPQMLAELAEKARTLRGLAGLKFLWEDVLLPLARSMLPGVERVVEEFAPDVVVSDQQALAGALVARRRGLPWATSATTSIDRKKALADLPKVLDWTESRLAELQEEAGLDPVVEPENSPQLVVVFSTPELMGDTSTLPEHFRLVGPSFSPHRREVEFPWERLADGERLLVSLGTLNAERGAKYFRAVTEALADLPLQVILVAPEEFGPFPENFLVRSFVPQLELLPHVQGVLCHAGHNTVCEALAHGLPLIVTPIKDDQPVVAQQVVDAGAGLRLSFARLRPAQLRDSVTRILTEERFRLAAARIRDSFDAAGGAARAARLLEELA